MNAVFKALADPTRRKVLELLRQRPMAAGELADHFPVSRPTMSAHFTVLREADLIEARRIGTSIIYQLKLSVLEDALLALVESGPMSPSVLPTMAALQTATPMTRPLGSRRGRRTR